MKKVFKEKRTGAKVKSFKHGEIFSQKLVLQTSKPILVLKFYFSLKFVIS